MVGNCTAVYHTTDNVILIHLLYLHLYQTVINQHTHANFQILIKSIVCDTYFIFRSFHLIRSQGKKLPFFQHRFAFLKVLNTNLRTFRIQQDGYRLTHFPAKSLDHIHPFLMILIRSMGKVASGNIHPL